MEQSEYFPGINKIGSDKLIDDITEHQYFSTLEVKSRWEVYKHSEDNVDFLVEEYERLCKTGNETILDVGCSDGADLRMIRDKFGHKGQLIGVDIDTNLFIYDEFSSNQSSNRLDLRLGSVGNMKKMDHPIQDETIDACTANYMLYHAPDLTKALQDIHRVLKPGGMLGITTSGPHNKLYHREFEKRIASYIGCEPPPIFSAKFNNLTAEATLPNFFKIVYSKEKFAWMNIDGDINDVESPFSDYINSLESMRTNFKPLMSRAVWLEALNSVVIPQIQNSIDKNGSFKDSIERHLYICQKPHETL